MGVYALSKKDTYGWAILLVNKTNLEVCKSNLYISDYTRFGKIRPQMRLVIHYILVFVPDEDKKSLALETEKCLELLYFSKKKCVQRHMFMGDSATYIVPRAGYEVSVTRVLYTLGCKG